MTTMINDHFILKNKKLIPIKVWENGEMNEKNLMIWAGWFKDINNRKVKHTRLKKYNISTVFLGLDHNFGNGKPLVFETMVFHNRISTMKSTEMFGGFKYHKTLDDFMDRYSTWNEAVKGHDKIVKLVKKIK